MECPVCESITQKKNLLYEDSSVFVMHAPAPAAAGHCLVIPKEHFPIIEQVPDYIVGDVFKAANTVSQVIFDAVGAHGTNIILENGPAAGQKESHVIVHVVPRAEGDGMPLTWTPQKLSEEEMSTVQLQLQELAKDIGEFEKKEKSKPIETEKKPEKIDEDSYLVKRLQRIP